MADRLLLADGSSLLLLADGASALLLVGDAATATGDISIPAVTVDGSGTTTATATGTISVPVPTVAGSGTQGLAAATATGDISIPVPQVAGSGTHPVAVVASAITFADVVAGTHRPRSRIVTLSSSGLAVSTFDPSIILSGNVSYDRKWEVRRTFRATLADEDASLAPLQAGDEFAPGSRVRIDRGVAFGSEVLWQTLGTYELTNFGTRMAGSLTIGGEDPFLALRQPFGEVLNLPPGIALTDAIREMLEPVLGDSTDWSLDGGHQRVRLGRSFPETDERLHAAVQLADDFGAELYADRAGLPVLQPRTDPNDATVAHTYRQSEGEARATSLERQGDFRPYNRVVVIGEPPGGGLYRAEASITDTASPFHEDRIGLRVAPLHRSAQIVTQEQANTVARSLLVEHSLWSDTAVWLGVPDPLVEAGDVMALVEPRTQTDASFVIDRVTLPVALGSMNITASRVVPLFA
jgi:hypothetical protein